MTKATTRTREPNAHMDKEKKLKLKEPSKKTNIYKWNLRVSTGFVWYSFNKTMPFQIDFQISRRENDTFMNIQFLHGPLFFLFSYASES